jgi:hypothetical protein
MHLPFLSPNCLPPLQRITPDEARQMGLLSPQSLVTHGFPQHTWEGTEECYRKTDLVVA